MPHHKSALKRVRQTEKRTERNRSLRSTLRTGIKKFIKILESDNLENAKNAYKEVQKTIDKAVSKGIIHRNTAARNKSRLRIALQKKETVATQE